MRAACIGECMIELVEQPDGSLRRGYGGDTLNTAVYMARLGVPVDYVTALGTDPWSDEMLAGWAAEGVGTGMVLRTPRRNPGLYVVQTDEAGERRFQYWRDTSAARLLFDLPETPALLDALAGYDLLYLSGITLSLYDAAGRRTLFDTLAEARRRGHRVAFDTNFRPRAWPDKTEAAAVYATALEHADIVLASMEDLDLLHAPGHEERFLAGLTEAEVVLKRPCLDCRVVTVDGERLVATKPVADVVDTTAAGDSFAAAYLAARLAGRTPEEAACNGHRLAGEVVRHRGAIVPCSAMPPDLVRFAQEGSPR